MEKILSKLGIITNAVVMCLVAVRINKIAIINNTPHTVVLNQIVLALFITTVVMLILNSIISVIIKRVIDNKNK